ncbi:carbon-nitrogen hydrolase family protein [Polycladidibacter stylochi]|uniref:carbon-nitrogen hydrolase family protein n=1 Tax=Polycladidibacter stylochi TaxID=1807766 RepID=UPI00083602BC|nr:carbon-nitrogen hydrolase family protein [Pseudovibrio stylochi]
MTTFRAAVIQLRSGQDPEENLKACEAFVREAAAKGAQYIQTPEMSNLLTRTRQAQWQAAYTQEQDPFLARMCKLSAQLGIYLHLGSLGLRQGPKMLVNRGFFISPTGEIITHYDKIHMFDVDLPNGESWRESESYIAGTTAPIITSPYANFGMAICYDVRQPQLFRAQAQQGADILTAPAAFTRQTGKAHWHVLQRARAIENGAYMISAAQGGLHEDKRETYGHSLVVNPWGEVIAELEHDNPAVLLAEIDRKQVKLARSRIPALANARSFEVSALGAEENSGD